MSVIKRSFFCDDSFNAQFAGHYAFWRLFLAGCMVSYTFMQSDQFELCYGKAEFADFLQRCF